MARPVRLAAHDPDWPALAAAWQARLHSLCPGLFDAIHHIGSTAIPAMPAKPVIDLLAVTPSLALLDPARPALAAAGLVWRGENGLAGRRYVTADDPVSGARSVQLHIYASGDPEIARHLAFRDLMRGNAALAQAYAIKKARCAALHPDDSAAYTLCKKAWISAVEAGATPAG